MGKIYCSDSDFYEKFWEDEKYKLEYALDSAVRDRLPAIMQVWGTRSLPATVLDFGCGNGALTAMLHQRGFGERIIGVDISKRGVESARKRYAGEHISFHHLDTTTVWQGSTFDVAIASHVLEHLHDVAKTLRKLGQVTNTLVLEVPLERCLWQDLRHFFQPAIRNNSPVGHVQFWNRQSFRELVEQNGYVVIDEHLYASAPFSPYTHSCKRLLERWVYKMSGIGLYSLLMATHYTVLLEKRG